MYFSSPQPFLIYLAITLALNDWHYHSPEGVGDNSCAPVTLVDSSEEPPVDTEQQVHKLNYNEILRSFEFWHFR